MPWLFDSFFNPASALAVSAVCLFYNAGNSTPASGWITVGLHGPVFPRKHTVLSMANQLHGFGFRQLQATSLKQKHVRALVDHWLGQNLSPGTIKNRMSCLRWWADRGDHLQLKASWTKGGRERTVPIRTREQRALLENARQLAVGGA